MTIGCVRSWKLEEHADIVRVDVSRPYADTYGHAGIGTAGQAVDRNACALIITNEVGNL